MTDVSVSRFDRERLDALVAEGWLRSQRHPDADLWIYNYTEKTQYGSYWTPDTRVCRGLILDADGNVVARPFPKFFNWGDPQVGEIPTEPYEVTEKIDGSLGIVYSLPGENEPRVATRGSFVSEQAQEATQMISDYDLWYPSDVTPLMEIIYPRNRVVVDYGDRRELILLAAIRREDGRDGRVSVWSGPRVRRYGMLPLATLQDQAAPNSEGFVVSFLSGLRVKVKFEEYVRLHRIVARVNARMVWESMMNDDPLDRLLEGVPDEIHNWIADVRGDLSSQYAQVELAARVVFNQRPPTEDRKTIALYFLDSGANSAVLFRMLDGKPYSDLIWKTIKPEAEVPGRTYSEDTA